MKEEDTYELIDKYLSGTLPEGDHFFTRLINDPELAEEIELQKLVRRTVVDQRLREVSKEIEALRAPDSVWFKPKYVMSGVLILFCGLLGILLWPNIKDLPKKENKISAETLIRKDIFQKAEETSPTDSVEVSVKNSTRSQKLPVSTSQEYQSPPTVEDVQPPSGPTSTPIQEQSIPGKKETAPLPLQANVLEKKAEPNAVSACDTTHIAAEVTQTHPCKSTSTGVLQINKVHGGASPYEYSIDGGKSYISSGIFDELPQGHYQLLVRDINNCSAFIGGKLSLKEKDCPQINSFVFDPLRETWEIPADKTKGGKIVIHDKSGRIVYSKVFTVQEQFNWDGTSENGETLRPGYYIYMIEHTDGSVRQGSVTLSY